MKRIRRSDRELEKSLSPDILPEMDEDLSSIAEAVAAIEDAEPPADLVESVMSRIRPKKRRRASTIWRYVHTPLTSFTITPLRLASVGVVFGLIILASSFVLDGIQRKQPITALKETPLNGVPVVFTFHMPGVSKVDVVGSFNRWSPDGFRMQWDEKRRLWVLAVQLERGRYEYAFLIDGGVMIPDPKAVMVQNDDFGNQNSVIIINGGTSHEKGI